MKKYITLFLVFAISLSSQTYNIENRSNAYTTVATGVPFVVTVGTSNFVTSGSGTALEAITNLTWTMPANTAANVPFSCHLIYHQAVGTAVVAFGIKDVTTAPTQINAFGIEYLTASTFTTGDLIALASTTATAIVTGAAAPTITTNWHADLTGYIEQPSGAASAIQIMVSTATAADLVTVMRGSTCHVN